MLEKDNTNKVISYNRPRIIPLMEFQERLTRIFETRWFSNFGRNENELSESIARVHGTKHCILVANATLGIQITLKALGLKGEVITSGFTFVATAHAIKWEGLVPVLCDIDLETLTISPAEIEKSISQDTSAILGVHVFGQVCDVKAIQDIGKKRNIPVVYDAAHCFGVKFQNDSVGNFGEVEILSFHATKLFQTFEGGAILTNDDQLARELKLMISFGFEGMDNVQTLGINAKMNEISAAYGLSLLPYIPETIRKLSQIHSHYAKHLMSIPGIRIFSTGPDVQSNFQYFVILIDSKIFGVDRDTLWRVLWNRNIQTRRYFYPGIHRCKPYCNESPYKDLYLPNVDYVSDNVLCLPCYYDLSYEDVDIVCRSILEVSRDPQRAQHSLAKRGQDAPTVRDAKLTLSP